MSINRHPIALRDADLTELESGFNVQTLSSKDMTVLLYPEERQQPAARDGVATCPVSIDMLAELRANGHTGIAPAGSPYFFSLSLAQ